jgi:nucleotide-binding universal stress UspA family protein
MHLPKNILVPTDFSETSEAALEYAMSLAALTGGSVTLMHAYEMPLLGFPDAALMVSGDLTASLRAAAKAALGRSVAQHEKSGVPLRTELREGAPYLEINSVADTLHADLIVIGTHARRGLSRALLGSVAENVIRTASRPVLTIHGPRDDAK